ncbi:MAG: T9SS type A sorting domain-containing protein [candidate division Zixibacteria bacterium]|nr:T9SS type A sorting domain-containing protein [candidate division Zixibacteria bacterium]
MRNHKALFAIILVVSLLAGNVDAQDQTSLPGDSLWNSGLGMPGVSGEVRAILYDGNKLWVGGRFINASGALESPNLAILNLDDSSWHNSNTQFTRSSDAIYAIVLDPSDSSIIVAGNFSSIAGDSSIQNIARYNRQLDQWESVSGIGEIIDGEIYDVVVDTSGRIFIGGRFDNINGVPMHRLASWSAGSGWESLVKDSLNNGGSLGHVRALSLYKDTLWVGGWFNQIDTVSSQNLVSWVDNKFMPLKSPGPDLEVYDIYTRFGANGTSTSVYVVGQFDIVSDTLIANGIATYHTEGIPFNRDINFWDTWGDGPKKLNSGKIIHTISFGANIWVGGHFTNGDSIQNIAVFAGGAIGWQSPEDFNNSLSGSPGGSSSTVYVIENEPNTRLNENHKAIGGKFITIGDKYAHGLAMFDEDYNLSESDWDVFGQGSVGYDMYGRFEQGEVKAVAVDTLTGSIYYGGDFAGIGNVASQNIIRWDSSGWHSFAEVPDAWVTAMAMINDTLYVAGHFIQIGANPISKIAQWTGTEWLAMGTIPLSEINKIVQGADGRIYVGGYSSGNSPLVIWDGVSWTSASDSLSAPSTPSIYDMIPQPDGTIICAGTMTGIPGPVDFIQSFGIVKYNPSEDTWSKYGSRGAWINEEYPRFFYGTAIYSIAFDLHDKLWAVGDVKYRILQETTQGVFRQPPVVPCFEPRVIRSDSCNLYVGGINDSVSNCEGGVGIFRLHGPSVDFMGSGITEIYDNGSVNDIALWNDKVIAVGDFDRAGGQPSNDIAIWDGYGGFAGEGGTLAFDTTNFVDTLKYGDVFLLSFIADSTEVGTLEFSSDSGITWVSVVEQVDPAIVLPWVIPKLNVDLCQFRTTDYKFPCEEVYSPTFTIYADTNLEVTRLIRRGQITGYVEPFVMGLHSWNFKNSRVNLWSDSLVAEIVYPEDLRADVDSVENFPDWFLFVDAFGEDWCYWFGNTSRMRPRALLTWEIMQSDWGGSCYGFSVSSLLWWTARPFNSGLILPDEYLDNYELNKFSRDIVNRHWIYQWGPKHLLNTAVVSGNSPWQTLEMIRDDMAYSFPRSLSFTWRSWKNKLDSTDTVIDSTWKFTGHNVVPYAIKNVPDTNGIYYIYVYDNNAPDDADRFLRVDSINNTWSYPAGDLLDTNSYFVPSLPINEYYGFATDGTKGNLLKSANASSNIILSTSATEEIVITDSSGGQIGTLSNVEVNSLPGATPVYTNDPEYKYDYHKKYILPDGEYQVSLSNFQNSSTRLTFEAEQSTHAYERNDASPTDIDRVYFGEGISVVNQDPTFKNISLTSVLAGDSAERYIRFDSLALSQNDSTSIAIDSLGAVMIENYGQSKKYSFILWYSDHDTDSYTQSLTTITLPANTNHKMDPAWTELDAGAIVIYIDTDQDGIFEDSIIADIATDISDEQGSVLPTSLELAQNYPNPFNPSTTIEFTINTRSFVELEILNILGQKIKTLIAEDLAAGNYEYVWYGKDNSGGSASSGVYFYRLRAGEHQMTKKMLLLK